MCGCIDTVVEDPARPETHCRTRRQRQRSNRCNLGSSLLILQLKAAMTKKTLCDAIAASCQIKKCVAKQILNSLANIATEELKSKGTFRVRGLCTLKLKKCTVVAKRPASKTINKKPAAVVVSKACVKVQLCKGLKFKVERWANVQQFAFFSLSTPCTPPAPPGTPPGTPPWTPCTPLTTSGAPPSISDPPEYDDPPEDLGDLGDLDE